MGGVCSIDADGDKSLDEFSFDDNGFEKNDHKQFRYNPKAPSKNKTTPIVEDTEKKPCKRGSTLCEKGLNSINSVSSKGRKLSKNLSQKLKTNKWKQVGAEMNESNSVDLAIHTVICWKGQGMLFVVCNLICSFWEGLQVQEHLKWHGHQDVHVRAL